MKLTNLAKPIRDILGKSVTLKASDATLDILAYNIADYLTAHYLMNEKKPWYGIDIDAKIKELKRDIAIAYCYKKKQQKEIPCVKEEQLSMILF